MPPFRWMWYRRGSAQSTLRVAPPTTRGVVLPAPAPAPASSPSSPASPLSPPSSPTAAPTAAAFATGAAVSSSQQQNPLPAPPPRVLASSMPSGGCRAHRPLPSRRRALLPRRSGLADGGPVVAVAVEPRPPPPPISSQVPILQHSPPPLLAQEVVQVLVLLSRVSRSKNTPPMPSSPPPPPPFAFLPSPTLQAEEGSSSSRHPRPGWDGECGEAVCWAAAAAAAGRGGVVWWRLKITAASAWDANSRKQKVRILKRSSRSGMGSTFLKPGCW